MTYNTKLLLTDIQNKPIPQFYDPVSDSFQPLTDPTKVKMTDGTDMIAINADGSINTNSTLTGE